MLDVAGRHDVPVGPVLQEQGSVVGEADHPSAQARSASRAGDADVPADRRAGGDVVLLERGRRVLPLPEPHRERSQQQVEHLVEAGCRVAEL